jgi:hypothetical protein
MLTFAELPGARMLVSIEKSLEKLVGAVPIGNLLGFALRICTQVYFQIIADARRNLS